MEARKALDVLTLVAEVQRLREILALCISIEITEEDYEVLSMFVAWDNALAALTRLRDSLDLGSE